MHARIMSIRRRSYKKLYLIAVISVVYGLFEVLVLKILGHSDIVYLDMIHSFIDGLMSYLTGLSIYLSLKRSSKRFPWGLYKIENLATLSIALFTLYILTSFGVDLVSNIEQDINNVSPTYTPIILATGSLVSLYAYRTEISIARKTKSKSVLSDAIHAKTDFVLGVVSAFIVVIEILSRLVILRYLVVVLIAFYILRDVYEILRDSIDALIDASPDQEFVEKISREINRYTGLSVKNLMLKKTGSFITGVIEIEIDPDTSLREAEKISRRLRLYLYRKYPELVNIVIKPTTRIGRKKSVPPRGFEPLTARYPSPSKRSSAGRSPS